MRLALAIMATLLPAHVHADGLSSELTGRSLRDEGKMSIGYEDWRARNPQLTRQQNPLESLPSEVIGTLQAVNAKVNSAVQYAPDPGPDHWDIGPTTGDCDDYVVTKLAALVDLGIPRSALRIVVTTADGVLHLVLAADVGSTTLILDNRQDAIQPWTERTDLAFKAVEVVDAYGLTYLATLEAERPKGDERQATAAGGDHAPKH